MCGRSWNLLEMMSNENAGAVGVLGAHIVKRCRKLFTCRQIEDRRRLFEQATGRARIGAFVADALNSRNEVIVASRSSALDVDLRDGRSIDRMYDRVGTVDAVVSVAGVTPFPSFGDTTSADFRQGFDDKLLGQIELVLRGLPFVADVARAFVKSVHGIHTGQVYELG